MPKALPTKLDGVVLVEPEVFGDDRGFLVETYSAGRWRAMGIDVDFVQDNHSRSSGGILRGLHFQTSPGQAKLVRCSRGRIWDVAVDLRRDSETYGRWEGYELDDETHRQLFVPVGFAEGLERTVDWYRENEWWWEPIRSGEYRSYYERQYGKQLS